MKNLLIRNKAKDSNLVPRGSVHPFFSWPEADHFFDNFFGETSPSNGLSKWKENLLDDLSPRLDIAETESEINVSAELPGIDEKDVEVNLEDDLLTIRGEKKTESKEEKEGFFHSERAFGTFSRSIRLNTEVDKKKITAKFKKGVLKITLPKTEVAKEQTHRIEVKGE